MNIATMNDLVSITDLARSASKLIGKLLSGESSQMVVLRNNKPAAVIITPELYDQMSRAIEKLETLEDIEIASMRSRDSEKNDLSMEELKEKIRFTR
jgi:PHD/YefM family antitoxin component YafN of YafNO toxin-antitoxin module